MLGRNKLIRFIITNNMLSTKVYVLTAKGHLRKLQTPHRTDTMAALLSSQSWLFKISCSPKLKRPYVLTQVKQKSQTSESFSQSVMHIFDWSCTLELSFVDNGLWSRELWKKKREFLKYCRDVVRNPEWFLQMKYGSRKNGYYLGIKFSTSCKKILPCWSC